MTPSSPEPGPVPDAGRAGASPRRPAPTGLSVPFVAGYARRTLYGAAGGSMLGLNDRSLVLRRVYVVRGRAVYRLDLDAWAAACAACVACVTAGAPWSRSLAAALRGREAARVPFHWREDTPWPTFPAAVQTERVTRLVTEAGDGTFGDEGPVMTLAISAVTREDLAPGAPPPPSGSASVDVTTEWQLVGPDDALLKRLPAPGRTRDSQGPAADAVDWRAELAEAEGWRAANARAAPVRPGQLYIAVPRAAGGGPAAGASVEGPVKGPVKVGFSREPAKRVGRLRSSYGLPVAYRLLHAVTGEPHEERALHDRLARHRVPVGFSGEWYRPVPAVLECLDVLLPRIRRAGAAPRRGEAFYPVQTLLRGLQPAGLPTRRVRFTPL